MEPVILLPIKNYAINKQHYDIHNLFKDSDNDYEYTVVYLKQNDIIGLDVPDLSIFKDLEWYKIKVTVNELYEIYNWSLQPTYLRTDTQIRSEEYLSKKPEQLTILKAFKDLNISLFQNSKDIYDYLYNKGSHNYDGNYESKHSIVPETTINKFRKWLSEHYDSIIRHYNYVVLNIYEPEPKPESEPKLNTEKDKYIDTIKEEQKYFTNLVIEIENIGYNFQESSGTYVQLQTSDLNELDDIMEIENHCRQIKQLLNNIYSNKIKGLTKK